MERDGMFFKTDRGAVVALIISCSFVAGMLKYKHDEEHSGVAPHPTKTIRDYESQTPVASANAYHDGILSNFSEYSDGTVLVDTTSCDGLDELFTDGQTAHTRRIIRAQVCQSSYRRGDRNHDYTSDLSVFDDPTLSPNTP